MDITLIKGAIDSIKASVDLSKSIVEVKKGADIATATRELNNLLLAAQSDALAAQSEQFAVIEEIRNLKEKIMSLEAWQAEKQRYSLKEVGVGGFAYALKDIASNGEPMHYLCTNCYQDGCKSILNQKRNPRRFNELRCPKCNSSVVI